MSLAGLCFDATGTLIETAEPVGEVYRRIALQHGIDLPAWRLQDAFARVLRHAPERGTRGDDPEARRRSELDWWSELVRQTFQATDSTALFDDFRALTELQRRGWPMAVVSNFDHRLLDILQVIELSSFFSRIALPFEVGQAKPARAIFASAAQALDTPIETLAYVGDDAPETLAAIADLGIRVFDAHQIERWSDWIEALGSPATFRATPVEPNRATRT
jgi:putative hydrolase of the HAD superfamily